MDEGAHKEIVTAHERMAFVIADARRCIGYRAPGSSHLEPCPDNAFTPRSSQCAACAERAMMLPCLRCTGLRCHNPARRDGCVQPDNHATYLAAFAPGIIKVGVSRWERRERRVREQGARAALIIARDDGQMVRRIEAAVAALGIPDRISPSERVRALYEGGEPEVLERELERISAGLRRRLPPSAWLRPPEPVRLEPLVTLDAHPRMLHPRVGEPLAGPIRAAAGSLIILEREDAPVAVELSSLIGFVVEDHAAGAPAASPAEYQLSLGI